VNHPMLINKGVAMHENHGLFDINQNVTISLGGGAFRNETDGVIDVAAARTCTVVSGGSCTNLGTFTGDGTFVCQP